MDRETQSLERSEVRGQSYPLPGSWLYHLMRVILLRRGTKDVGRRGPTHPTGLHPACQGSGFLPSLARKFSLN